MSQKSNRALYGSYAYRDEKATNLPTRFPRVMGPNCIKYLQEVIDSGLQVDMVGRFEKAFAEKLGIKHCIATPGCTPALAALAAAFEFEPGDEIIVSPLADYGTIMGLIKENYIPVFADTEPNSVNLSARTIEKCITDRTRAILVVHKTGIVCDMDPINELARKHNLIVYEDACQSIFSTYKGRFAGTLSRAAGFSFDPEKTMGSDTGGCVVTNDDELAEKIRFIAHSRGGVSEVGFGRKHIKAGYAYRMAQCTAGICLAQLEIIEENVRKIDKLSRLLIEMTKDIPGVNPIEIPEYQEIYSCWMFSITIAPNVFKCSAEEFAKQLVEEGLPGAGLGKYYLMPVACTFLNENAKKKIYPYSIPPASYEYSYDENTCPIAWNFVQNWIRWTSLTEKWTEKDCEVAADIIRKVADRNRR